MNRRPASIARLFIKDAARTPDNVSSPIIGVPMWDPVFEVFGAVAEGGVVYKVVERGVYIRFC